MNGRRHKRPIRNGRLGEIKGQFGLKLWSSARYTRRAGWRRNCHAYAAISVPGVSRKFGGPTLQREAFQFGDNFINDRITDLRRFEAGDPPQIVSVTGSICRKNTYDEFRG